MHHHVLVREGGAGSQVATPCDLAVHLDKLLGVGNLAALGHGMLHLAGVFKVLSNALHVAEPLHRVQGTPLAQNLLRLIDLLTCVFHGQLELRRDLELISVGLLHNGHLLLHCAGV